MTDAAPTCSAVDKHTRVAVLVAKSRAECERHGRNPRPCPLTAAFSFALAQRWFWRRRAGGAAQA